MSFDDFFDQGDFVIDPEELEEEMDGSWNTNSDSDIFATGKESDIFNTKK